jgi:hypothetical protein
MCNNQLLFSLCNFLCRPVISACRIIAICFNPVVTFCLVFINLTVNCVHKIICGATGSDEPWPAEQLPLAVFPDCTRQYWVDMWSAHRIPQLHFQVSKPDRYFFIQVTTQFIRSRGWVDQLPQKNLKECPGIEPGTSMFVVFNANH